MFKLFDKNACDGVKFYNSMTINSNFCKNAEEILVDCITSAHLEDADYRDKIINDIITRGSSNDSEYKGTYTVGSFEIPYAYVIFKTTNDAIQYANIYRDIVGQLINVLFTPDSDKVKYSTFEDFDKFITRRNNPVVYTPKVLTLIQYIQNSAIMTYVHRYCNKYKHNEYIEFNLSYDLFQNCMIKDVNEFEYKTFGKNPKKDVLAVANEICLEIEEIEKQLEDCIDSEYVIKPDRLNIYRFPIYMKNNAHIDFNAVKNDSLIPGNKYFVCYAYYNEACTRIIEWEYDVVIVVDNNKDPIGYLKKTTPDVKQGCYFEFEYINNITDNEIAELLNGTKGQKVYFN